VKAKAAPVQETVTLFIGGVNVDEDGERDERVKEFFASKGVEISEIRGNPKKRFVILLFAFTVVFWL